MIRGLFPRGGRLANQELVVAARAGSGVAYRGLQGILDRQDTNWLWWESLAHPYIL